MWTAEAAGHVDAVSARYTDRGRGNSTTDHRDRDCITYREHGRE